MSDDIETLRAFITGGCATQTDLLSALDRIVIDRDSLRADVERLKAELTSAQKSFSSFCHVRGKEIADAKADRDSLRKALDDRHAADKKAWSAIMRATGKKRGLPDNKEVVAFYVAEVERLEKELKRSEDDNAANFEAAQAECGGRLVAEIEVDSLRAKLNRAKEAIRLLLATPEIADANPRDKDKETHHAEREARAVLSELSADAPAQQTHRDSTVSIPIKAGVHANVRWDVELNAWVVRSAYPAQQTQIIDEVREAMVGAEKALDAVTTRLEPHDVEGGPVWINSCWHVARKPSPNSGA